MSPDGSVCPRCGGLVDTETRSVPNELDPLAAAVLILRHCSGCAYSSEVLV